MTTLTIHQPEHMPWSGFFHKMAKADIYVLLDNVQFKKNNWQNRNRIVDKNGNELWLSVPIQTKGHITSTISETLINNNEKWHKKYLGRINDCYCKHPCFKEYFPIIEAIINQKHSHLAKLNFDIINFFRKVLGINNKIIWASELGVTGKSSELLVNICQKLNADKYLSGPDGANYMDLNLFAKAGVTVSFHQFTPPVYNSKNYLPDI